MRAAVKSRIALAAAGPRWHEGGMASHPLLAEAIDLSRAGRDDEAVRLIARLAGEGNGEALFLLGDCYWRGSGVPQDVRRGRELFRQASDAGNPIGRRAFTNLLASGIAGAQDWPRALERLREEARSDARRAQMLALVESMRLDGEGSPLGVPPGEGLSQSPLVFLFRGAFTAAECDYLKLVAEPTYEPSLVGDGAGGDVRDPIRTSDGSTLHWLIEDPAVHAINRRLAALSGTAVEQGEPLQILRYRPGQQYRRHVDWLGPEKARVLTALIYLNDDYQGGETEFNKTGLKVRGRRGDCLVFRSVGADGRLDPLSEHAGLPVTGGTKYLASRWIRAHRYSA